MDKLKKYINAHQDEFDDQIPPQNMWNRIECRLGKVPKKKNWTLPRKLLAAASVLFLVGLGFVAGSLAVQKNNTSGISPEFAETASYYQRKIDAKKRAVAVHTTDSLWIEDIDHLELVMNELKEELKRNPQASKGEIIQAMIDNYNIRLAIMDKILEKTNNKTYLNTKPSNNDSTE